MEKMTSKLAIIFLFTGLLLTGFENQTEASGGMLKVEDRGPTVEELQHTLIQMGYLHTDATGYYGTATEEAVKQFQSDFGLEADGVSGPNTLHEMENVRKIAQAVHGEARGESFEGQVAVASVIRNRMLSPEFPASVDEVIKQKNAFTAVRDGQYYLEPNATSYKAVKEAWQGWDPSGGSHYYYNPEIATSEWIFTRTVNLEIGNHVFAN
ncbi:cell wall hydrolase [Alteribacillus iranensis]|uniref:N-acetylmuramoyl-L-alanine amidase n=1 Tax=Alteribacillus iranensis TaxID=930128 RepID=A0A1I2DHW0_9BACI|nr:cell wall hydrolase [Alteribacillus iranensis]SFE80096.1 N-acetylmuramoyl-L-alanine amidase [Alteribacillus iranensis]